MSPRTKTSETLSSPLDRLTASWGTPDAVSLYLERCQIATPDSLVQAVWRHVHQSRHTVHKVVDFGAGDGRFARHGRYAKYVGYEIDPTCVPIAPLPKGASLKNCCAFSKDVSDADVCIGNPPFVRNQDLPPHWREHAAQVIARRTGVAVSGLANAWQYFFFLALASVKEDGVCALVLPYEWVSRPSSKAVRDFISSQGWAVSVYRLVDTTFKSVLTTSSITIVDKARRDGSWSFHEETALGEYSVLPSVTGGADGLIPFTSRRAPDDFRPVAKRGLSPGSQRLLTLTDGERARLGLRAGTDVVPCVTTLRHIPAEIRDLDVQTLREYYRVPGHRCWLIRTDREPTKALQSYLDSVPEDAYQTSTCLGRDDWWRFVMPAVPEVLVSMSFKGPFPKVVQNLAGVRAVGGVYGIYNLSAEQAAGLTGALGATDIRGGVVAHSNGLRKIEIGQLNTLLDRAFGAQSET